MSYRPVEKPFGPHRPAPEPHGEPPEQSSNHSTHGTNTSLTFTGKTIYLWDFSDAEFKNLNFLWLKKKSFKIFYVFPNRWSLCLIGLVAKCSGVLSEPSLLLRVFQMFSSGLSHFLRWGAALCFPPLPRRSQLVAHLGQTSLFQICGEKNGTDTGGRFDVGIKRQTRNKTKILQQKLDLKTAGVNFIFRNRTDLHSTEAPRQTTGEVQNAVVCDLQTCFWVCGGFKAKTQTNN